jgi:hypothetical protein
MLIRDGAFARAAIDRKEFSVDNNYYWRDVASEEERMMMIKMK